MQHSATWAARAARALRRPLTAGFGLLLALAGAAQAQSTTYTFGSNTYTVPAGVTAVRVVALGGSGGTYQSSSTYQRAKVQATLTVMPGEVLTATVGRMGGYGSRTLGGGSGGSNGGGAGFNAGGGGGATDLRRSSSRGSTGDYLTSRNALLVAGGGGGDAGVARRGARAPGRRAAACRGGLYGRALAGDVRGAGAGSVTRIGCV